MAASDSGESKAVNKLNDRILQTIGGILLLLVTGISGWQLLKLNELDRRNAVNEANIVAHDKDIADIKKTGDDRATRLEAWMGKLSDKIDRISEKIGAK